MITFTTKLRVHVAKHNSSTLNDFLDRFLLRYESKLDIFDNAKYIFQAITYENTFYWPDFNVAGVMLFGCRYVDKFVDVFQELHPDVLRLNTQRLMDACFNAKIRDIEFSEQLMYLVRQQLPLSKVEI